MLPLGSGFAPASSSCALPPPALAQRRAAVQVLILPPSPPPRAVSKYAAALRCTVNADIGLIQLPGEDRSMGTTTHTTPFQTRSLGEARTRKATWGHGGGGRAGVDLARKVLALSGLLRWLQLFHHV